MSLEDEFNTDMEENKVSQKIDEQEIKKIIVKLMEEYMEGFQGRIKAEIEDNKKYIYSVEDEIRH